MVRQTSIPVPTVSVGPIRGWRGLAAYAALLLAMSLALYMIFMFAPAERVQGQAHRIFYGHVSSAWLAFLAFAVVVGASVMYLWRRSPRWDYLAVASAEIGVLFTTLALTTGSIWARVVWGVWWTWDPKLTTTLVLWFIYAGYMALRVYVDDPNRKRRLASVVGIFGFVNVPVVWFSAEWWRGLHPPPTVTQPGGLPSEMLVTLLVTLAAFTIFYGVILRQRYLLEGATDEAARLRETASRQYGRL